MMEWDCHMRDAASREQVKIAAHAARTGNAEVPGVPDCQCLVVWMRKIPTSDKPF
jgi:hypothetical protein